MTTLTANAYSLSMLLRLNADTLIWVATILMALLGAGYLAAELASTQALQPGFL